MAEITKQLGTVGTALELLPDAKARADKKGQEIAKLGDLARRTCGDFEVEIRNFEAIDGGVQYEARAWDSQGNAVGFGKDGTVEWERFRVFNPPILVPDGTKTQIDEFTEADNLKEDLTGALILDLAHTLKVKRLMFSPEKIQSGKVGNTTLTAYPAAGANEPVDGWTTQDYGFGSGVAWSTIRGATGTGANATDTSNRVFEIQGGNNTSTDRWVQLTRSAYLFDTSSIGTDNVDSAILSIYGVGKADGFAITPSVNIVSSALADPAALSAGDYDSFGTTAFATAISYASWSTTAYNDFTLNASGIANIDKGGTSYFGAINDNYDRQDSEPSWVGGNELSFISGYYADQTGTTNDPKLVVEHSAAGGGFTSHQLASMGVG